MFNIRWEPLIVPQMNIQKVSSVMYERTFSDVSDKRYDILKQPTSFIELCYAKLPLNSIRKQDNTHFRIPYSRKIHVNIILYLLLGLMRCLFTCV
jgi:hypothetical protein